LAISVALLPSTSGQAGIFPGLFFAFSVFVLLLVFRATR
jgi:hypothetical protein